MTVETIAELFRCHLCGRQFPTQLDRIEHKIDVDHQQEEKAMGDLENELTGIEGAQATEHTDVQRIIADLEAKGTAGTITDDERARLEALKAEIAADTAAIDAGDPAPVVTDPGSGDGTTPPAGDGSATTAE